MIVVGNFHSCCGLLKAGIDGFGLLHDLCPRFSLQGFAFGLIRLASGLRKLVRRYYHLYLETS